MTARIDRKLPPGQRTVHFREWFVVSLPIFLVESFFFLLTNADVLMVGFYMEPDDVAVYFATVKTLALVHFVYFAVKAGVAQRYAAFTHGEPEKLAVFARETVAWTFWPSLFMAFVVLVLGEPMLMLFGPGFDAGYPLLFLLVVGVVARAAVGPCESLLTMTGNQNICAFVYALTLAVNVGLSVLLIPHLRPVGRGHRHGRLDDLRGLGAVLHRLAQARHRHGDLRSGPAGRGGALMAAVPLLEEMSGGPSGAMIAGLAGLTGGHIDPAYVELLENHRPPRRLAIYPASAGFELVEELDYLCARTIEPNVFFNPRFLAPAMPRLEDREVRLAVIRDGDEYKNRLRLLVPFSIEKPAVPLGVSIMRTWSSPFGPLGTPLVDRDDPEGVIEDFFAMLSRPHLKLPKVLVLPDMRLDGAVATMLASVAETRGLPLVTTGRVERAFLESKLDGEDYLKASLRPHHYREFRRLKRRLADQGRLEHHVARGPEDIRHAIEAFLSLEAAGWKGREGTAMVDRPLPRGLRPRSGPPACRAGSVPRPFADAGRQGHRLPDRLRRGRRGLHLEDRL